MFWKQERMFAVVAGLSPLKITMLTHLWDSLFLKVNNNIPEHKSSKVSKSIELCWLKGMSKGILKEYIFHFHFSICVYLFEDKTDATFIAYIRYSTNL